jgi:hypothetical protein
MNKKISFQISDSIKTLKKGDVVKIISLRTLKNKKKYELVKTQYDTLSYVPVSEINNFGLIDKEMTRFCGQKVKISEFSLINLYFCFEEGSSFRYPFWCITKIIKRR